MWGWCTRTERPPHTQLHRPLKPQPTQSRTTDYWRRQYYLQSSADDRVESVKSVKAAETREQAEQGLGDDLSVNKLEASEVPLYTTTTRLRASKGPGEKTLLKSCPATIMKRGLVLKSEQW